MSTIKIVGTEADCTELVYPREKYVPLQHDLRECDLPRTTIHAGIVVVSKDKEDKVLFLQNGMNAMYRAAYAMQKKSIPTRGIFPFMSFFKRGHGYSVYYRSSADSFNFHEHDLMNIGFAYVARRCDTETFKFILNHYNCENSNKYEQSDILDGKPLFLILIESDIQECNKLNSINQDGNGVDYKQFFVNDENENDNKECDEIGDIQIPPFNGFIAIHSEIIGYKKEDIDQMYQFQCDLLKLTKIVLKYQKNIESIAKQDLNNGDKTNEWNLPNCKIL